MYLTKQEYLRGIELPRQTETYKPVSHGQLIDLISESVDKAGFTISKQSYTSAMDGQIANGRYDILNVKDEEMGLQIAWQNSYNKSLTLKFAIGATVFICQNGMVRGDMGTLKRKHTGDVQEFTPIKIIESIKAAGEKFTLMQQERQSMKSLEIDTRIAAELVGRMIVEENFIQSTQLNAIRKEIKHPSFDYNASNSLWELYQHTTYAMKEVHPRLWMQNHISAHEFFMGYYNEAIDARPTTINIPIVDVVAPVENDAIVISENQLTIFDTVAE
jgi:hypothetical protein